MKKIIRIAKLELNTLFYSPIAWFLLIVFLFQCGLAYTGSIEGWLTSQQLGGAYARSLSFLTQKVFVFPGGTFSSMTGKLYLYLPLLTMGLVSREISSGTIRLLYSSPIKVSEIIFGKFLAMMAYSLLLTLILGFFVIAGLFNIQFADYGMLLSGLLGIYLLLNAYSAIGLFMSCLSSYQVVAALSTLVLLGELSYIGTLWQDIDFVRDLTYFLSISGRTENMLAGLITTKDILYFAVIIYIFLGMSIFKLQAGRESKPVLIRAGRYVVLIVSALTIGYLGSRPGAIGYLDATATKSKTLAPAAQKIIKEMDGPLEVTSYINLLENHFWYGTPAQRNADMARWEPYLRFKPDIRFKYVYYYDSIPDKSMFKYNPGMSLQGLAERYSKTSKVSLDRFKTPAEIRKLIDLRPEGNRYVMQLKYKGRSTFLRLFDDPLVFPSETETSAALKRMMGDLPKIAFLEGELERSIDKIGDRDYMTLTSQQTFRYALVNQGFDVETISLKDSSVPSDIAGLVIADPRTNFDPVVLAKLQQYIDKGGNLLIAGEPGKQAILNPLLQQLGVQIMDGVIVQPSKQYAPDLVLPYLTGAAGGLSKALGVTAEDSARISMPGVSGLAYAGRVAGLTYDSGATGLTDAGRTARPDAAGKNDFVISPLAVTDGKLSWNKKGRLVTDSAEVVYSPGDGDEKGTVPLAFRLTRMVGGREQRIVVAGDADFLSNAELARRNVRTANFSFNTAVFGWFSYGTFPIDSSRPKSKDTHINLTDKGLAALKVLFLGVLPGLLLLFGAVLLIRRKRK